MFTSEDCLSPCCTCAEESLLIRKLVSWEDFTDIQSRAAVKHLRAPDLVHCIDHDPPHTATNHFSYLLKPYTKHMTSEQVHRYISGLKNNKYVSSCFCLYMAGGQRVLKSGFTPYDPLLSPYGGAAAWNLQAVKQVTPLFIPGNQKTRMYLHRWRFRQLKQTASVLKSFFRSYFSLFFSIFCGFVSSLTSDNNKLFWKISKNNRQPSNQLTCLTIQWLTGKKRKKWGIRKPSISKNSLSQ